VPDVEYKIVGDSLGVRPHLRQIRTAEFRLAQQPKKNVEPPLKPDIETAEVIPLLTAKTMLHLAKKKVTRYEAITTHSRGPVPASIDWTGCTGTLALHGVG